MKFEIFKGRNGDWYFRIVARNGELIAMSEGYERKDSIRRIIRSILNTKKAKMVEL